MENLLAKVGGEYLGESRYALPDPETATTQTLAVDAEVPGFGRVRITYERHSSRKGRLRHWFWTPAVVERIETQ